MALMSMTGFGRGEASSSGIKVEVELGSVNRKQFDVRFNMPRSLSAHESSVYELIHATISRGSITGGATVSVSGQAVVRSAVVDRNRAQAYIDVLRKTARSMGLKDDLSARSLLQLPDVVKFESPDKDARRIWPLLEKALKQAIVNLNKMKKKEGKLLEQDLVRRLRSLEAIRGRIVVLAPGIAKKYRGALEARLNNGGYPVAQADPSILKEVALFAERTDISEEVVRLNSHIKQGLELARSTEPAGRPLDFLCQEMLREINTVGSKANDVAVARHVICFKAELESFREQVQNVE